MQFREVSTDIVKLEKGKPVIGLYQGTSTRPWTDPEDGLEKEITQFHMLEVDDKGNSNPDKKFVIFADAGLQNKFNTENIKAGQIVRITRGEQQDLGKGGRRVNTYKLEVAE